MADKVNIPATLTVEQIRGVEKIQAKLSAMAANAFKNVDLSKGFNAGALSKITTQFDRLSKSLIGLQSVGGKKTRLYENVFGSLNEGGQKAVGEATKIEAALKRLTRVASSGSPERLRAAFDKYGKLFGPGFSALAFDRIGTALDKQSGALAKAASATEAAKQREIKANLKAASVAVKAAQAVEEAEYNKRQAINAATSQNRGLTGFLQRSDADEQAEKTAVAQRLALDKEVLRVKEQQVVVSERLVAAERAGISASNQRIKQGRAFVNANPTAIAASRLGVNGPSNSSVPTAFDDNFFRSTKQGIVALTKVKRQFDESSTSAHNFGKATALAAKRYGAFLLGTFVFQAVIGGFSKATAEVVEFDKTLTRLRQVSNASREDIDKLGSTILQSAKRTGAGVNDIAEGLSVFAQAGFDDVTQLERVSKVLAKLSQTPSFDSIKTTAEGLVAVFGQFGLGLSDTESILNRFNFVAKETAIESQDLIEAASKSGSAFVAAGSDLNKFIELTTLLRSSTRESAAVVSTFFRTTLTKFGGTRQQNFLSSLGIDTKNLPVIQQLEKLAPIFAGSDSNRRSSILKELADVRQASRLGKTLLEINNQAFLKETGQRTIFDIIRDSQGSIDRDVSAAADNISTSTGRMRAALVELIEGLGRDENLKRFVKNLADITVGMAGLAKNFKLVIGFSTAFASLVALPKITQFVSGIRDFATNRAFIRNASISNASIGSDEIASLIGGGTGPSSHVAARRATPPGRLRRFGTFLGNNVNNFGGAAGIAGLVASTGAFNVGPNSNSRFNTVVRNAGAGAAVGAGIGSIIPGVGTAGGAIIGTLVGVIKGQIDATRQNTLALQNSSSAFEQRFANKGNFGPLFQSLQTDVRKSAFFDASQVGTPIVQSRAAGIRKTEIQKSISDFFDTNTESGQNRATSLASLFSKFVESQKDSDPRVALQSFVESSSVTLEGQGDFLKIQKEALLTVLRTLQKQAVIPNTNELTTKPRTEASLTGKVISDITERFRDLSFNLTLAGQGVNDFVKGFGVAIGDFASDLTTIITDFNQVVTVATPSDNRTLLKRTGIDLGALQGGFTGLSDQLRGSSGNRELQDAIREALKIGFANTQESDQALTLKDFLANVSTSTAEQVEPLLLQLQGLFREGDFNDVLRFLDKVGADAEGAADQLLNFDQVVDSLAETIRASIDAFNQELQVRKNLADAALSLESAIFDLSQTISSQQRAAQDRRSDQSAFINDSSPLAIARNRASTLTGRAGSSGFGNQSGFITDIIAANQQRLASTSAAQAGNRGTSTPGLFRQSLEDQIAFDKLQQQLNQRLAELDIRIGDAATAADTLREAFTNLREDVRGAGQSVRQFTIRDFGKSLRDVSRFGASSGGGQNLSAGFASLGRGGLDRVTQLLSLVGNIGFGGGVTGNQLLGNINQKFGASAIAATVSAFTGTNVSAADIEKQLEGLRQQQEAAAALEQALRQQQVDLLEAQRTIQSDTLSSLNAQFNVLQNISKSLEPLEDIRKAVNKLFGSEAQLVTLSQVGASPVVTPTQTSTPSTSPAPQRRPGGPRRRNPSQPSRRQNPEYDPNDFGGTENSLSVEPIRVSVSLTATDILGIAGPQIFEKVMAGVGDRLAPIFAADPEIASRIASMNQTTRTV